MRETLLVLSLLAFAFGVGMMLDVIIYLYAPKLDKWLHDD